MSPETVSKASSDSSVSVLSEPPLVTPQTVSPGRKRGKGGSGIKYGALFLGLFLGYNVIPFYYYYYDIKSNCSQVLKNAAVTSDEELRRDLLEVAERHGIEVAARDIGIQRVGSRIKIWLKYQEHLDISFKGWAVTLYTFDFTPSAERVLEE